MFIIKYSQARVLLSGVILLIMRRHDAYVQRYTASEECVRSSGNMLADFIRINVRILKLRSAALQLTLYLWDAFRFAERSIKEVEAVHICVPFIEKADCACFILFIFANTDKNSEIRRK